MTPVDDANPLQARVALVTGAARGIGRAVALALAAAGADVAVADRHLQPFRGERYYRLRERWSGDDEAVPTARAIADIGRLSLELTLDVAEPETVARGVGRCESELGAIDILVNAAGIVNNVATIEEMSSQAWEHEVRVNLTGAFHCVQATVPAMARRGWGRVINIASVSARVPSLGQPAYAASKAGLIAFTQAVAQEFGRRGVTANAVLPGLIATPLVLSMPEELRQAFVRRTAVGRVGEPREIAHLVTFLAGPEAAFLTGAAIPCDGGLLHAPVED